MWMRSDYALQSIIHELLHTMIPGGHNPILVALGLRKPDDPPLPEGEANGMIWTFFENNCQ
jgi:hypothetical protein